MITAGHHPDRAAREGRIDIVHEIWETTRCRPSWYGMEQAMIHGKWDMVHYLMQTFSVSCSALGLVFLVDQRCSYMSYIRYFILTQYASALELLEPSLRERLISIAREYHDLPALGVLMSHEGHVPWTYQQIMEAPTLHTLFMNHDVEAVRYANREHGFKVPTHWIVEYLSSEDCKKKRNRKETIAMIRELHNYHGTLTNECARVVARNGDIVLHDMFLHWRYFFCAPSEQEEEDARCRRNEIKAFEAQQEYIRCSMLGMVTLPPRMYTAKLVEVSEMHNPQPPPARPQPSRPLLVSAAPLSVA